MVMRIFFGVSLSLLLATSAEAAILLNNTYLVDQIKPNPTARSKPTFPQFASVQFLESDTDLTFKSKAGDVKTRCAALGYPVPVSQCSGVMAPSYLCSSELSVAGAAEYTSGCCNSKIYTATTPESCTNNSTALMSDFCYWGGSKKYRCSCDRSRYPYSSIPGEGCGSIGDFNVLNMCQAPNAAGETIKYYTGCCPKSYSQCNSSQHQVGSGASCMLADGTIKYEKCVCASHYDVLCGDGKLIDASNYCMMDGKKFTTNGNCEGRCEQGNQDNIDDTLYGQVLHCLYETDGATIKEGEHQCIGGDNDSEKRYYDLCKNQGYTKSVEDCYIDQLILYCPTDSSKVWCLDSRYCTGYPVGLDPEKAEDKINITGGRFEECNQSSDGHRYKYLVDECNKCWYEGEYKGGCDADESELGDTEKCCKRGYTFNKNKNGRCEANTCNPTKYPYEQNPNTLLQDKVFGDLEICYQADTTTELGYRAFFGYKSCFGESIEDFNNGGMWIKDTANPRKCVCDRTNAKAFGRTPLPFGTELFFDANADEADNYTHVGFKEGSYGVTADCTDGDGSYYGYSSCYIGSTLRKESGKNTGMCLSLPGVSGYTTIYPYYIDRTQSVPYANRILGSVGTSISKFPHPVVNKLPDDSKVYCINKNTHFDKGSAAVREAIPDGCDNGWEEECNICYHTVNLVEKNGKFEWNDKGFRLKVHTYTNTTIGFGFEMCPNGFLKGGGNYGNCYKECHTSNLSECRFSDVVIAESGKAIGIVYARDGDNASCGSTGKLHILAIGYKSGVTQKQAQEYASGYEPDGLNDKEKALFGKGNWDLPNNNELSNPCVDQASQYQLNGTMSAYGASTFGNNWSKDYSGTQGYYRNCCYTVVADVETKLISRPVVRVNIDAKL